MTDLEDSILRAMDCADREILPFLPYILQDFWEIGSDPATIIGLIGKHRTGAVSSGRVLDLGCGKGAVSVQIARKLGMFCFGLDGMQAFVDFARQKALEFEVSHLCHFETGDMRNWLFNAADKGVELFDVIILGAIGPVLGNYKESLLKLKPLLAPSGLIIMDDGYLPCERNEMLRQVGKAGMLLLDEVMGNESPGSDESYDAELAFLVQRCGELSRKYPAHQKLFTHFVRVQSDEYQRLKTEFICATMVFKPKAG